MVRILLSILFLLLIHFTVNGQFVSSVKLYGAIITEEGESLPNVHIINHTKEIGTISNNNGFFSIHCYYNDTIWISSIGYRKIKYIVPKINNAKYLKNFTLQSDTIYLTETVIYPYPATAEALKKEFFELSMEVTPEIDLHLEMAEKIPLTHVGFVIQCPFTKLYETFSRHAKLQRKHQALVKANHKFLQAAKLYNRDLVRKLTGLKDEKEIIRFMEFCDLEPEFILTTTTYELYLTINNCYKEFVSINK